MTKSKWNIFSGMEGIKFDQSERDHFWTLREVGKMSYKIYWQNKLCGRL